MEASNTILRSRTARTSASAVLALEVLGALLMWAPVPLAWLWIGGRVYAATGSLAADGFVGFLGFIGTLIVLVALLRRLDDLWLGLRRAAGYDQREGALQEVVTISGAFGLVAFTLWYYVFSHAYVLPFMPSG
jgi:hypothetical protein